MDLAVKATGRSYGLLRSGKALSTMGGVTATKLLVLLFHYTMERIIHEVCIRVKNFLAHSPQVCSLILTFADTWEPHTIAGGAKQAPAPSSQNHTNSKISIVIN